jgi:hypothetical protein
LLQEAEDPEKHSAEAALTRLRFYYPQAAAAFAAGRHKE